MYATVTKYLPTVIILFTVSIHVALYNLSPNANINTCTLPSDSNITGVTS